MKTSERLLQNIRNGQKLSSSQQLHLTAILSLPAIMANMSTVLMGYIDTSMVGHLGANEAASIGLVASSTWLFSSLCNAVSTGFSVQVAHRIGAKDISGARAVLRQSLIIALIASSIIGFIGLSISKKLPIWLGGNAEICEGATLYFSIFSIAIPVMQFGGLATGMLQCSGNIKIPSMLNILMCILDVVFNFLLIFPTRKIIFLGKQFTIYGAGMGLRGAIYGSVLAALIVTILLLRFLLVKSPELRLIGNNGSFRPTSECLKKALKIGAPVGLQQCLMNEAQIIMTTIVASLGTYAIAAHNFGIEAEALCYMPGYGVASAAITLVGQSIGANRKDLSIRFARISVGLGMLVMTLMGIIMYATAPFMMQIMTNQPEIIALGTDILRIEAFAEPMFAAAIVSYNVFVGAGDTIIPSIMNLTSMWIIRLILAFLLAPVFGLKGVWIAMCTELIFRGIIFLIRLKFKNRIKLK